MTPATVPAIHPALLLLQSTGISSMGFVIQIVAIFAIFYFLMIRPQQKQRKQHEERIMQLKRGDAVVTTGGLVGEVVHVKETLKEGSPAKTMEDHVTIKSGESRVIVERGKISRITSGTATASPAT